MTHLTISERTLTKEEASLLKNVCSEHDIAYSVFCGLIIKDVLHSQELIDKYIKVARQFEEDQKPASIEELKALRQQLRQQEEELEALRQFKQVAQNGLVRSEV